jgi:hypothetical protein
MIQLHSIKIESQNFCRRKYAMRAADRGCQILARFFVDNILYVSYFLTDNVVIQLTLSALASGRAC